MEKIDLNEKLSLIDKYWDPKIIGELNGQHVKIVKLKDKFVWHHHDNEDELFLVLSGKLKIEFRDKSVDLSEGEMIIIPRGVEHRPVAESEVHALLFEPKGTINTGNNDGEMTVKNPQKI